MCIKIKDDALIIFEGPRRLQWQHVGSAWRLTGLWPTAPDRLLVDRYVDAGRPILVVLDREPSVVIAFVEEVPEVPDGIIVRGCDNGLIDLEVPMLDWLPGPLRSRGAALARQAALAERATPLYALPPLLVDMAPPGSPVRFAVRTGTCAVSTDRLLHSVVRDLFDKGPRDPAAGSMGIVDAAVVAPGGAETA
ncbi:MAG: hypothetical protein JWO98_222 [Frankiales bacterium]|nr:hypothetical protein [Frankiales bacterium]